MQKEEKMKKNIKRNKEYHSFEEYKRTFFPCTLDSALDKVYDDPERLGADLAKESLNKIKELFLKKQTSHK